MKRAFTDGALITYMLGIGILIFPISLLGLFILIGVLGFTPLFAAVVFLRNAVRAYGAAKPFLEKKTLVYSFLLAALFSAVVPPILNAEINSFKNRSTKTEISIPMQILND